MLGAKLCAQRYQLGVLRNSSAGPSLCHLLTQLEDRFCGRSNDARKAMLFIPTNLTHLKEETMDLIKADYEDDRPFLKILAKNCSYGRVTGLLLKKRFLKLYRIPAKVVQSFG